MTATQATAARFVGQSVKRKEDPRLLTGHGRYLDDVRLPGELHIAFLRSEFASAKILGIDTSAALALEGVEAVITGADLADEPCPLYPSTDMGPAPVGPNMRPLAEGDVRFVGDPIAMVIAESRYIAEDALDLITVEYEPLPAVSTVEQAVADGAHVVHPEVGTNYIDTPAADDPELEEILRTAPHVYTHTFSMARMTNVPMEGRGMIAHWDPYMRECRLWASTQSPGGMKAFAGRVLQIPAGNVKVEFGDVGGGFGQKMYPTREEGAVLLAAKRVSRPVKWVEDRRENLIAANQARHDFAKVTMALDDEAHILAATIHFEEDLGSYPAGGGAGGLAMLVGLMFTGPYKIPKMGISSRVIYTNTCGKAAFRGPWAMETIAREQMIEAVAREMGIDALELRRRNVIKSSELPYIPPSGMPYDIISVEETLEQAAEMSGWETFAAARDAARANGKLAGIGMSLFIEPSAVAFGGWATESATLRINVGGTVEVLMGSGSHGHSLETTIPQVVADYLGCSIDDVVLRQGGDAPFGPGTGGSRSAVILGGAAATAATSMKAKVLDIAAHLLEASSDDLEINDSIVSVKGTPSKQVSFGEVAATAYINTAALPPGFARGLETAATYEPPMPFTWSNACHVCVAEIDPITGMVELKRYIVSEDCGVMINPMVVEGQIAGGVVQGIGGVLFEDMAYDDAANPLATTFLDYLIPTAPDVPLLEYGHIEKPSNTLGGYKGMGEGGAIASPAAVANAINDALSSHGVSINDMPMTPTKVVEALDRAAS
ncbi:MAG: xanthine dehydrogenase family protein molybdopterin-binding subunit [Acidimicrobiia bacterium]